MPDAYDLIPRTGLLKDYLDYARTITDAPDLFHIGAALTAFSASVSDKAILTMDRETGLVKVPLHLWTLLLGNAGVRKSTVCNATLRMLVSNDRVCGMPSSPEALFDWLSRTPTALIFDPEARMFEALRNSNWSYGSEFLRELQDSPDVLHRLLGGRRTRRNPCPDPIEIRIENPHVSVLSASNISLLTSTARGVPRINSPSERVKMVLGRFLPLYVERERFEPIPLPVNEQAEAKIKQACKDLSDAMVCPIVTMTLDATSAYDAFADSVTEMIAEVQGQFPRIMVIRLPSHIARVAALYALSSYSTVVDEDLMSRAIALGKKAKEAIRRLADEAVSRR